MNGIEFVENNQLYLNNDTASILKPKNKQFLLGYLEIR